MIGCVLALLLLLGGWLLNRTEPSGGKPASGATMTLKDVRSAEPLQVAGLYNADNRKKADDRTGQPDLTTPAAGARSVAAERADTAPAAGVLATPAPAPTPETAAKATLTLVLTEAGESTAATRLAIEKLPAAIVLGFTPYAAQARQLASEARRDGHQVIVGLPMQPKAYPAVSPGKNTLLVGQSPAELTQRLEWALGRIDSLDGVYTMMGSAFTTSREDYAALLRQLAPRKLTVLDSRSIGATLGPELARRMQVPMMLNNAFIEGDAAQARTQLDQLVETARTKGHAIGLMRASPQLVAAVADWLPRAQAAGVRLVPLSQ